MKFNYQNIYLIDRIEVHTNYVQLILNSIFQFLYKYDKIANDKQINVLEALKKDQKKYPYSDIYQRKQVPNAQTHDSCPSHPDAVSDRKSRIPGLYLYF
mgnify:FL=1